MGEFKKVAQKIKTHQRRERGKERLKAPTRGGEKERPVKVRKTKKKRCQATRQSAKTQATAAPGDRMLAVVDYRAVNSSTKPERPKKTLPKVRMEFSKLCGYK